MNSDILVCGAPPGESVLRCCLPLPLRLLSPAAESYWEPLLSVALLPTPAAAPAAASSLTPFPSSLSPALAGEKSKHRTVSIVCRPCANVVVCHRHEEGKVQF